MILSAIDYVLDRVTMYRLAVYYLSAILFMALILSLFGVLHYTPLALLLSTGLLLLVCWVTNVIFEWAFDAPVNIESVYITALILACIIPPVSTIHDLPMVFWAGVLAIASKFILAIRRKHVFNPAAIAVVLTGFWLLQSATWWISTAAMLPVIIVGGVLLTRKIRRADLVASFFVVSVGAMVLLTLISGKPMLTALNQLLVTSPLFFFAFVMLTEPLTSPPTKQMQMVFGGLVGLFFVPQLHIGTFYFAPELALVVGNIFAYIVSPKVKEKLQLVSNTLLTADIVELVFKPSQKFAFVPGQYMEFTLPHSPADARGNRRYFTIASSPTESEIKLGVRLYQNGSTFKNTMSQLQPNQSLMAAQIAGDFTLPKDPREKLVFIAGGIGVTPFRSMIKYLLDTGEQRDIVLIYANKEQGNVVYKDVFDAAEAHGLKTVYLFNTPPAGWTGPVGNITDTLLHSEVPDFAERTFYISGPQVMVSSCETILQGMGVKQGRIKKDFFPGLV